jgi:general secretion pathway protein C
MLARLAAFVIWSLVAATAVFWALRFAARSPQAPPYAVAVGKSAPMRGDLTRLFGAPPLVAATAEAAAPEAPSRFKLVGVMAPRTNPDREAAPYGLALIAVDGKPAKAYSVGSRLDNDLVLQSVGHRSASIGPAQGERSVLLELPALPAPATGVLPGPGAPVPAAPVPMRMPPPSAAPVPQGPAPVPVAPAPVMQAPAMQPQAVPAAVPTAPSNPGLPTPDNFRSQ